MQFKKINQNIHMTIDSFSSFLHMLFFILNVPNQIKANIIADYYSQPFAMLINNLILVILLRLLIVRRGKILWNRPTKL